jgi:DNA-binding SARP family transcriptional activator
MSRDAGRTRQPPNGNTATRGKPVGAAAVVFPPPLFLVGGPSGGRVNVRYRIELLGGLRVQHGDRQITRFPTRKAASLLAYLAYYLPRSHSREVLVELLWPESDVEAGRSRLSVVLSSLRQQLESPGPPSGAVVQADRFAVGLNPSAVTTDVAEFEVAVQAAEAAARASDPVSLLTTAVERYGGVLLPGYYEDWVAPEQQRLAERFLQALRQLTGHLERSGEFERALQYARRAVSVDPLREEAHELLIRLHAAAGQPGAALRQYRELERMLKQEFNAAPSAAIRAAVDQLQRRDADSSEDAPGQGRTQGRRSSSAIHHSISRLEPVGGAVPLNSPFYVVRPTDDEFAAAIEREDSIVLVKGTRQVGKTSLLARGLQQARQAGARVVLNNLEMLNAAHFASADTLLLALAESIAEQLDLPGSPEDVWEARRGANPNFQRFMRRQVLGTLSSPLVWGLDGVDRLFDCSFGSEIFALFRSWHSERALDPAGPWSRLTLAMAYATEAHLFITNLNKSPFNVGTGLTLDDFTLEHVADLNLRYGSPLKGGGELERFHHLVSGHPDLVRRGLHEMASRGTSIAAFEARADSGDWIFGDHLQRMLVLLARNTELCEVVRGMLQGKRCPSLESFYRLRSAGIVSGASERDARLRCQLYATYLTRHLL